MTTAISVTPTPNADGWTCKVRIDDDGRMVSDHTVTVSSADKERFAPQSTVEDLVTRSFEFLLEHEPAGPRAHALTPLVTSVAAPR